MTVSFSDSQLAAIMAAASVLPVEERAAFLRLVGDQLKIKNIDVDDATRRALLFFQQRGMQCAR
jgi:hypothetical protein